MALISDFSEHFVDLATGEVSCVIGGDPLGDESVCPTASTFNLVSMYSESMDLWMTDFRDVLVKMTTNGIDTTGCTVGSICDVGSV
jgi:hypothetical protein